MSWLFAKPQGPDPLMLVLEELKAQRETNQQTIERVTEVVNQQAAATTAMAQSFTQYLKLFEVKEPPVVRTTRDEDEVAAELARKGYPVNGTYEEQLAFLTNGL